MANINVDLTDNSDVFLNALPQQIEVALEAIGLQAEGYAKLACPVDTGRLRNSISHATDGDAVYIGTNVEYAPYVELGTRKMSPRPFLEPAASNHGAEYRAIAEQYLKG